MIQLAPISGLTKDGIMSFSYVPPHQLRDVWDELIPGLERVRTSSREVWIAEDVYARILYGQANLYVFRDSDDKLIGFGVFEVHFFPQDPTPCLNIWIGYSNKPAHGHYGEDLARELAARAGITRIVFCSPQDNPWLQKYKKITTWYEVPLE